MNAKELRNLQEAYLEVVENQQLDELSVNKMLAYGKAAEKNRADLNKKWDKGTATHREKMRVLGREEGEARASDKVEKKTGKRPHQMNKLDKARYAVTKEQVDIYDIILSHLLDEGYADTEQAAEAIMVNMSEDWRESIVEEVLDEAEGSYGQTPTARKAYGDLANKRRNTPASGFAKRGEKTQKVKSASKHFDRTGNPDAGNRGKKSTKPHWTSGSRKGMTQKDRDWSRGADEYGHSSYDPDWNGPASGPGGKPKGKKAERQRKTGVSAD
jgi:hypothetical protein